MQGFVAVWLRSIYLMGSFCLVLGATGLQAQEAGQESAQAQVQESQQEGHPVSAQIPVQATGQEAAPSGRTDDGKININLADAHLIADTLDGIGKVRAEAIIRYREESGEFRSLEELGEVSGIGEQTLMRNSERIVFD